LKNIKKNFNWLKLPPIEIKKAETDIHMLYGSNKIIEEYCKTRFKVDTIFGEWVHGVSFPHHYIHPRALIGGNYQNIKNINWVVNKKCEDFLKSNGFQAKAIGLPIIYVNPKKYIRKPNSLLIMPSHSSYYVQQKNNQKPHQNKYILYLKKIINKYEYPLACVHNYDFQNHLWKNEFEHLGVEIISGAGTNDENALERIIALMSQFEYVTSNVMGSHIAYAAAFGAKVSINGPYHQYNIKDFLNEPIFLENPSLLDHFEKEEEVMRKNYPFLFVEPNKSKQQIDWGREMIGFNNKVSAKELMKLFKVDSLNLFSRNIKNNSKNFLRKFV
jgi:hypothetical protein